MHRHFSALSEKQLDSEMSTTTGTRIWPGGGNFPVRARKPVSLSLNKLVAVVILLQAFARIT